MTGLALDDVRDRAHAIRRHIVEMCATPSGGHLGGCLSLADILAVLYSRILRVDPERPDDPGRDVLVLSKGHGAIALYAALAVHGFLPVDRLSAYGEPGSLLMAHPHPEVPGVEVPSGALGHGLAIGAGMALGRRIRAEEGRCFVVLGDGELQEGSVWEAAMGTSSLGLDRLVAIVDRNTLQITGPTEEVVDLEPLEARWRAFGWTVRTVDGHDVDELTCALTEPPDPGSPTVVLAHTVKGRGLPYVEGRVQSHFARLGERQYRRALATLDGNHAGSHVGSPT